MDYKVIYQVFNIPNNTVNMGQIFDFTYNAEEYQLSSLEDYVIEYLQNYITLDNFEILSITKMES